jgi:hypothetical protein
MARSRSPPPISGPPAAADLCVDLNIRQTAATTPQPPADSSTMAASEQQPATARISSFSAGSGRLVTPFWKGWLRNSNVAAVGPFFCSLHKPSFDAEKYERDARRYWDIFYKRHEDKVTLLPFFLARLR